MTKARTGGSGVLIALTVPAALAASLALAGCQALFTTSPFSFLQRDVSRMSAEQQVAYAEDALDGGDEAAMAEAYAAIRARAATGSDPALTHLAAQLAMELSGAPQMVWQAMDGTIDYGDETSLDTFLASVDGTYVDGAADLFLVLQADNDLGLLSSTELLLGVGCILFQAAEANGDVSTLSGAQVTMAQQFAADGLVELASRGSGAGDLDYDMLDELNAYLAGIP